MTQLTLPGTVRPILMARYYIRMGNDGWLCTYDRGAATICPLKDDAMLIRSKVVAGVMLEAARRCVRNAVLVEEVP